MKAPRRGKVRRPQAGRPAGEGGSAWKTDQPSGPTGPDPQTLCVLRARIVGERLILDAVRGLPIYYGGTDIHGRSS